MDKRVGIDLKKRAYRALLWLCFAWAQAGIARVEADESGSSNVAAGGEAGPPVELCPLFGGSCCSNCSVALRHRWNISLCMNPDELCCISEMCSQQAITSQRPADSVSSTRTECETEGGSCQPWYSACGGTKVARRCGYIWQSCCNASRAASSALPEAEAATDELGGESTVVKSDGDHKGKSGTSDGRRGSPYPALRDSASRHVSPGHEVDDDSSLNDWTSQGQLCGQAPHSASDDGTPPSEWPWQAHVETEAGVSYCSGVVIDKDWILTSASCFNGMTHEHFSSHRVAVGRHDRSATGSGYQTYSISAIIRHPLYGEIFHENKEHHVGERAEPDMEAEHSETEACGGRSHGRRVQHNQAMLRLSRAIAFDEHVSPVCLPTRHTRFDERSCVVSGLLRHSSHKHALHPTPAGENGVDGQPRVHSSNGRIQDAVACGRLLGGDPTDAQMCFQRDEHEGLPQLRPGAFVTCLSDRGHHIAAAVNSGSFRHCHGKVVSAVAALPPSAFWIASVMESVVDASAADDDQATMQPPHV